MFPSNFGELLEACISFCRESEKRMKSERVQENRAKLSSFVEAFHKQCGTLTPSVQERIEDLKNEDCIVLMTAHQPNFFAYSGVLRKATLNFVLAERLHKEFNVPVVNFFGIADQDFTDDRWVRSCELPAVQRSGGILSLNVKVPEKMMLNRVSKPSSDHLKSWRTEIEKWIDDASGSLRRSCNAFGFSEKFAILYSKLRENFGLFWNIVEDSYEHAEKYSDFNAFVMSKIINSAWGYDTLFTRFSECQQIFVDEFGYLLSRFDDYSLLLKEARELPGTEDLAGGVSDQEPWLAPFWYHCDCGGKFKLFVQEKDGSLFGTGNCVRCGEYIELGFGAKKSPDISGIASKISARAIPMSLVFFNGLVPSCYVGGIGGFKYLLQAQHIANRLEIPFPPLTFWRPHDRYLGLEQAIAVLEQKRICADLNVQSLSEARNCLESRISEIQKKLGALEESRKKMIEELKNDPNNNSLKEEIKRISISHTQWVRSSNLSVVTQQLKTLENVNTVLKLVPCIIDYAVNVGLKEASDQWIRYLIENGNLSLDFTINSVLDEIGANLGLSPSIWEQL